MIVSQYKNGSQSLMENTLNFHIQNRLKYCMYITVHYILQEELNSHSYSVDYGQEYALAWKDARCFGIH